MARAKKRKPRKPRNLVVLGMILANKSTRIKDKRATRGGNKNNQRELLDEADES